MRSPKMLPEPIHTQMLEQGWKFKKHVEFGGGHYHIEYGFKTLLISTDNRKFLIHKLRRKRQLKFTSMNLTYDGNTFKVDRCIGSLSVYAASNALKVLPMMEQYWGSCHASRIATRIKDKKHIYNTPEEYVPKYLQYLQHNYPAGSDKPYIIMSNREVKYLEKKLLTFIKNGDNCLF